MAYDHSVWDPTRQIPQNIRSAQNNDAIITGMLEVNGVGVDGSDADRGKLTTPKYIAQANHPSFDDPSIYSIVDDNSNQSFYKRVTHDGNVVQTPLSHHITNDAIQSNRNISFGSGTFNVAMNTVNASDGTTIVYGGTTNLNINRDIEVSFGIADFDFFISGTANFLYTTNVRDSRNLLSVSSSMNGNRNSVFVIFRGVSNISAIIRFYVVGINN